VRPAPSVRYLLLAAAVLAARPALLAAQGRFEFTPFAGSYYHITHIASGSGGPFAGNDYNFDQNNAITVGARLTVPVGNRFSVEGEFAYSPSGVRYTEKDIGSGIDGGAAFDGNLVYGSVRAVITPRRSNLFLLAGPAIVHRGGDAWSGYSDLTDFGGVAGFGIRANVTPKFRINLTAETYLYSLNVSGVNTKSKFQSDLLVTVGVPISLGSH
jgi:hypothetical protein